MGAIKQNLDQILIQAKTLAGLQGSLLSAAKGNTVQSILITSGRDQEGKSTVATGIAIALAENARVLLVDANFRRPALAKLFEAPAEPGFSDFLGGASLDSAVRSTGIQGLSLLTEGVEGTIAGFFRGLPERFLELSRSFDYVVFDGDSVLTSSEAALLAGKVDGVVLVAECEQTKREILSLCEQKLTPLGGKILGVILNKRQFYIPGVLYGKI